MGTTKLLFLAEEDVQKIMDVICRALDVPQTENPCIFISNSGCEVSICAVSRKMMDPGDAEFVLRQIVSVYAYYSAVETSTQTAKENALKQIELSEALVIIEHECTNGNGWYVNARLDCLVQELLDLFCGLYLADDGHQLLNEELALVFSDNGTFEVEDFKPCKER